MRAKLNTLPIHCPNTIDLNVNTFHYLFVECNFIDLLKFDTGNLPFEFELCFVLHPRMPRKPQLTVHIRPASSELRLWLRFE
jgi:hypothetical protein